MGLTIIPLDVGVLYNDKSNLTPRRDYGITYKAASIMFYIQLQKRAGILPAACAFKGRAASAAGTRKRSGRHRGKA